MEKPSLSVRIGQYSDAGRKAENQDFYGAILPSGHVLAMKGIALAQADGISTSAISAQAAQTAIKAFLDDYYATPDSWSVQSSARKVIDATNAWLFAQNDRALNRDKNAGLVCTFDALIFKGCRAHLFHIGDGRIWRLRGGRVACLTKDHRVQVSPQTGYLSRALGIDQNVEIDHASFTVQRGDIFIVTTDGIHDVLTAQDLHAALEKAGQAQAQTGLDAVAHAIAERALGAGSDDNLTIQLVEVTGLPAPDGFDVLHHMEVLPPPPPLRAGATLDGWRIIRRMHASSRSQVFQVAGPDGARGALKTPSAELLENEALVRRFMLEEWAARRIDNDHVLTALASSQPRTALYSVMTYLEGQTLRQWMASNAAPTLSQVQEIVRQLAAGLRAFHRRDMLHQDVRPENVMIDAEGTVQIIDFGSVLVRGIEEAAPGVAGPMPGTFQYTAPEYLSGDAVSWRSDQFALGVIAYEMLTGSLPYGAQVARVSSRQDQRRLQYASAREHDANVPIWLDDTVRRAVHPDPLWRYDALSEFIADFSAQGHARRPKAHVPLAQRSPVRFWKTVCALQALILVWLLILQLGS